MIKNIKKNIDKKIQKIFLTFRVMRKILKFIFLEIFAIKLRSKAIKIHLS